MAAWWAMALARVQVVLGELSGFLAAGDDLFERRLRVEEQHADGFAAALHGHADRLADVVLVQALHGAVTGVGMHVGDEHALVLLQHVIDDRAADGEFLGLADARRGNGRPWG